MSSLAESLQRKRLVYLVGRSDAMGQVHVLLGMYPALAVAVVDSIEMLQKDISVSQPDCIVAPLQSRQEGHRLLSMIKDRERTALVFVFQRPLQPLVRFVKEVRAPFAFGKRGFAPRVAKLVASTLCVPPHVVPQLEIEQCGLQASNGAQTAVTVVDIATHAAILQMPRTWKTSESMDFELTVQAKRDGSESRAAGRFEAWRDCPGGEVQGLLRFDPTQVDSTLRQHIWDWTERAVAATRGEKKIDQYRGSWRIRPPVKFSVRVNALGDTRKSYFRLENIGQSGALLSATARFETGLKPDMTVEMLFKSVRGQAKVVGVVARVGEPGFDPQRSNYHAFAVRFDRSTRERAEGLAQLLRQVGLH
ncbi:MAG: hypothetical protein KC503_25295 [Myxococcales bacterium]|nr:hypothetical protein [Myxococcales bacterium]